MKRDIDRINSLRKILKDKGLDALMLFYPENILLSTGMLPAAPFTVSLVTKDDIILVTPWWREKNCLQNSWAEDVFAFDWLRSLKWVEPQEAIVSILKNIIKKYGIKSMGYDGNMAQYMPNASPSTFFSYRNLQSSILSFFKIGEDVSAVLEKVRSIKTPYEIEKLRIANKVSKEAIGAFYKYTIPGSREADVAGEILNACQKMAGKEGISFMYCDPPQITSGIERTSKAYSLTNPTTGRIIKEGEPVMLELGGCTDGYWFDITRAIISGNKCDSTLEKMWQALDRAINEAIYSYIPGKSSGNKIWQAAFSTLAKSGFKDGVVHGLGHGLGFAYHESLPGIGPGAKNIIYPNMVTSMEPGLYFEGRGGIRIEQNVVWGKLKGEAEILTSSKYSLK